MIIDATIQQLRAYCPPFAGRVAGAAAFQQGLQNYNANMVLPAAYVILADQESDGNHNMIGVFQIIHMTIGIIVELDATPDRRGQAPAMEIDDLRAALCLAILNWPPAACISPNGQGYWFSGGQFLDLDRARLFYRFDFGLKFQLDDTDAWTPPSVPLESIEVDIYRAPPWAMVPTPAYPPAAVIKIPKALPAASIWDAAAPTGPSIWDDGQSPWDVPTP